MLISESPPGIEHPDDKMIDFDLFKAFEISGITEYAPDKVTNLKTDDCVALIEKHHLVNRDYKFVGVLPNVADDPGKSLEQLRGMLNSSDREVGLVLVRYDVNRAHKQLDESSEELAPIGLTKLRVDRESANSFSVADAGNTRISDKRLIQMQFGTETSQTLRIKQKVLIYELRE